MQDDERTDYGLTPNIMAAINTALSYSSQSNHTMIHALAKTCREVSVLQTPFLFTKAREASKAQHEVPPTDVILRLSCTVYYTSLYVPLMMTSG